jgi:hypothetical protein
MGCRGVGTRIDRAPGLAAYCERGSEELNGDYADVADCADDIRYPRGAGVACYRAGRHTALFMDARVQLVTSGCSSRRAANLSTRGFVSSYGPVLLLAA